MDAPDRPLKVGLVSVSDRASGGVYKDEGIPALKDWLGRALASEWTCVERLIPDEQPQIEATLAALVDTECCDLVLTTGGTGPAARDVTPEATLAVGDKVMPGFGEQMRQVSLEFVPTAILSRQVAVIRKRALIINLPGQPKAIRETLEGAKNAAGETVAQGIFAAVPYCVDLIGGPYIETNDGGGEGVPAEVGAATETTMPELLDAIQLETGRDPERSVIWLHGLGADGRDFVPIVGELDLPPAPIRFVFPHAPVQPVTINNGMSMRAWYDIVADDLARREDERGVRASQGLVEALIARERSRGIPASRILLAGFSQGGAISLQTGLRHPERVAGIMALSTYVPIASALEAERNPANRDVPIFMAHGTQDPIIPLAHARRSRELLERLGYPVEWHEYAMPHSVSPDELHDIGAWLRRVLA